MQAKDGRIQFEVEVKGVSNIASYNIIPMEALRGGVWGVVVRSGMNCISVTFHEKWNISSSRKCHSIGWSYI